MTVLIYCSFIYQPRVKTPIFLIQIIFNPSKKRIMNSPLLLCVALAFECGFKVTLAFAFNMIVWAFRKWYCMVWVCLFQRRVCLSFHMTWHLFSGYEERERGGEWKMERGSTCTWYTGERFLRSNRICALKVTKDKKSQFKPSCYLCLWIFIK